MNDRLRTAMLRQGVATEDLADECGVDPKTVERWIGKSRVPHRRHRWVTAKRLGTDETYLWPDVLADVGRKGGKDASRSELVEIHVDRAAIPQEKWLRLLNGAQERIDVLVYSGTFFAQTQPRVSPMLAKRISEGAYVRLCFGDPNGEAVAVRDREESLCGTMAAKIRASLTYYREIAQVDGCEIRLHDTTPYNSIFRYDDDALINSHVFGQPASLNPTYHFRRVDGGALFEHHMAAFERVWATALPWLGTEA
ncbi:transcriptional regulator with XRE-family HTH domain [Krasilnikovia cinnamomea]|uniref:Transcriptional regulator with XRE-family HTH domain n=1 Tax=Krasilnikovia cinnamomea TaxID=349313 RepID=A0A4Q7ZSA4_9ACTN|nr:helix-turn-helix domain-containing protein [Krasilnikovia cinnamomea]RZU54050.1 transcriptional regulator with XRE-family HTH domain [Krasilnikovia cinnamomea]